MSVQLRRQRGAPALDHRPLARAAGRLLAELGLADRELSVLLTDDARMRALNLAHRGRDRATDVLSFSQLEGEGGGLHPELLGDVVISLTSARRQARARGVPLRHELLTLLVHGVLHLAGFDHEGVGPARARAMRAEQARLVALLTGPGRR
ncbi:MAG TPA: rRNA maturation RNase YbeY [Myxococcota bacterium]|nr:rRNA maturation RNase YbeY [Myxococcota bacterium]HRY92100.1 rRNA maturation RNase YbeY [Myxococcota bacterium]